MQLVDSSFETRKLGVPFRHFRFIHPIQAIQGDVVDVIKRARRGKLSFRKVVSLKRESLVHD